MPKLPFMQFFPADWLRDTRRLAPPIKAVWVDIIAIAWNEPDRGVYERTVDEFLQEHNLGSDPAAAARVLDGLKAVATVTEDNGKITVLVRRQVREEKSYKDNAIRQARHREKLARNGEVTPKKSEGRSHKQKEETKDIGARPPADAPPAAPAKIPEPSQNAAGLDLSDRTPARPQRPAEGSKRPAAPKQAAKATPPRELWQTVYGHAFDWLKKRKHGADPHITAKERGLLASLYDAYGPFAVMALWDLWTEPEQKWSKWAYQRGHCLEAFYNSTGAILDDARWKEKARKHEERWVKANPPPPGQPDLAGVLSSIIASNCKVPTKPK